MATADTNGIAVAPAEPSAALVPFQRHQPGFPLCKNVNSAVSPARPASHFSGYMAQMAQFVH